ncbi:hypothetical protein EVG20_g5681 [Dentipellis fragilis]|uniref:Uncharacterized protein n=1 Tax=Dentipellis fragilis TaxID=205917 RepID=A0A4Y9YTW7_9AGAM|nr:hypothetical protein EVG20_g5681 [Dentipellis fragilis]
MTHKVIYAPLRLRPVWRHLETALHRPQTNRGSGFPTVFTEMPGVCTQNSSPALLVYSDPDLNLAGRLGRIAFGSPVSGSGLGVYWPNRLWLTAGQPSNRPQILQIAKRSRAEDEGEYQAADKEESSGRPVATVSTNFVQLIETRTLRIEY